MQFIERLQHQLNERYAALAQERALNGNPVYFIEHGLDAQTVVALQQALQVSLGSCPIESQWWNDHSLPLLAYSCEIGYEYLGNGTEYWPSLCRRLSCSFGFELREWISRHFKLASRSYRGVEPPQTEWANAFCHIAWPITHAVLPKDVRLAFIQKLSGLTVRVGAVDDAELVRQLRRVEPDVASRRYESWLENSRLALSLARGFLQAESALDTEILSQDFRQRLQADLLQDTTVRRQLLRAKRRQNQLAADGSGSSSTVTKSLQWGRLVLRRKEDNWELCGELPDLPLSLRQVLARPLRSRGWQPVPWGLGNSTPLPRQAILEKSLFPIAFRSISRTTGDAPFFVGYESLGLSAEHQEVLSGMRFHLEQPLLFSLPEDDVAYQITSEKLSEGEPLWALVSSDVEPDQRIGLSVVGAISGALIVRADPSSVADRTVLGLSTLKQSPIAASWTWLFPSSLTTGSAIPDYYAGEPLAVIVGMNCHGWLQCRCNGDLQAKQELTTAGILLLPTAEPGLYEIELATNGQVTERKQYRIRPLRYETDFEPVCDIRLYTDGDYAPTARELVQQRLSLKIIAPRQLSRQTIRIRVPGTAAATERIVETLPIRFGPQDTIWKDLLSQLDTTSLAGAHDLTLAVEVGRLARSSWTLESETEELWWEFPTSDSPKAVSDAEEFETVSRSVDRLWRTPQPGVGTRPCLILGQDRTGQYAHFDALFVTEKQPGWPRELPPPSQLSRQFDDRPKGIGVCRLVNVYIELANARTDNLAAEMHRRRYSETVRQWILLACCGTRWIEREKRLSEVEDVDPLKYFWNTARRMGAGFPEEHSWVDESDNERAFAAICLDLSLMLPEAWWQGPIPTLTATDGERLDSAFQRVLGRRDYWTDTQLWQDALTIACHRLNGDFLASLLYPPAGSDDLLTVPLAGMTLGELAHELHQWRQQYLGGVPTRIDWDGDQCGTWLALLLQPSALRRHPWDEVVRAALSDMVVARAGAFIAWRVRQLECLGEFCPTLM